MFVRRYGQEKHGLRLGEFSRGNLESLSRNVGKIRTSPAASELNPPRANPTRQKAKQKTTPVASRRTAAVTEGSETRPLGKPARVSGSRRETSVSEIRGYLEPSWPVRRKNGSTRALENRGHDLLLVTGGEEQEKKRPGHPLLPHRRRCAERASVHEHCRQMWPYLVDPASSHMLVSKIKPCMSKYILLHSETANGSLNQLWFIRWYNPTWITVVILELIHATKLRPHGKSAFIRSKPIGRKAVLFGDSG